MLGPEILLWPFLENNICHMPNTRVPFPALVPSDALSLSSALLCLHVSWCPWKVLEGNWRMGGRNKPRGFSWVSASAAGAPLWLQIPEDRILQLRLLPADSISGFLWPFFYIPPVSGVLEASCTFLSLGCLIFSFGFSVFHYMCK